MEKYKYDLLKEIVDSGRWSINIDTGEIITLQGKARHLNNSGYLTISTRIRGKDYFFLVHQAICVAAGLNPTDTTIDHINGIKTDNRISNLEMVSLSENVKRAYKTGLTCKSGERSGNHKLSEKQVNEIYELAHGKKLFQREIAEIYNIEQTTVSAIKRGALWKHIDRN